LVRRKRDIRVSVSEENSDIFDIWKTLKSKKYAVSHFVCIAIREKFERDVRIIIKKEVLSPVQQDMKTPKYVRPPKSEAEIKIEKEREAERIRIQEGIKRQRRADYEAAKAFREKQD